MKARKKELPEAPFPLTSQGFRLMAEADSTGEVCVIDVPGAERWDIDSPKLYTCEVALETGDVQRVKFASEKSLLEKSQPENATSANEAREKSQAV